MTKLEQAARQALHLMNQLGIDHIGLREALADQAEQEPVAWMWRCKPYCDWPNWGVSIKRPVDSGCGDFPKTKGYEDIPLYAARVQQVDLTDDEIHELVLTWENHALARAVIAAYKEKNK